MMDDLFPRLELRTQVGRSPPSEARVRARVGMKVRPFRYVLFVSPTTSTVPNPGCISSVLRCTTLFL